MFLNDILKGFLIGLVFGVPAGAIGALTIKRTLKQGFLAGLVTGLGSSIADILYAGVGISGITVISGFIEKNQRFLSFIGGIVIIMMGFLVLKDKKIPKKQENKNEKLSLCFLSSFAVAVTNPATVLSFLAAFAVFEIGSDIKLQHGVSVMFGILLGTLCWWIGLSFVVALLRTRITDRIYFLLNRILGCMLFIFGAAAIIKSI